jgi:nucleoside-diphosphate-sugar epimerase
MLIVSPLPSSQTTPFLAHIKMQPKAPHISSELPVPFHQDSASCSTTDEKPWSELFYNAAMKGTLEMLRAASSTSSVQRVAITSSGNVLASVVGELKFSKGDSTVRKCPTRDKALAMTNAGQAYITSKILASNAARRFVRDLGQE